MFSLKLFYLILRTTHCGNRGLQRSMVTMKESFLQTTQIGYKFISQNLKPSINYSNMTYVSIIHISLLSQLHQTYFSFHQGKNFQSMSLPKSKDSILNKIVTFMNLCFVISTVRKSNTGFLIEPQQSIYENQNIYCHVLNPSELLHGQFLTFFDLYLPTHTRVV